MIYRQRCTHVLILEIMARGCWARFGHFRTHAAQHLRKAKGFDPIIARKEPLRSDARITNLADGVAAASRYDAA
jgi:hypothetical protein